MLYRMHCCSYNKGICEKGIKQEVGCVQISGRDSVLIDTLHEYNHEYKMYTDIYAGKFGTECEGLNISGEVKSEAPSFNYDRTKRR